MEAYEKDWSVREDEQQNSGHSCQALFMGIQRHRDEILFGGNTGWTKMSDVPDMFVDQKGLVKCDTEVQSRS